MFRENPRDLLESKLLYLRWLRTQIEAGIHEGLCGTVVEATCFPWNRRHNWESFPKNELIRLLSFGHFSRSELVRSFVRTDASGEVFPTVYQMRWHSTSESLGTGNPSPNVEDAK